MPLTDIREASSFVITTEPLGFVLTKQVNDFLMRVLLNSMPMRTSIFWHVLFDISAQGYRYAHTIKG